MAIRRRQCAVLGIALLVTACAPVGVGGGAVSGPQPEPSDEIDVTYLELPEGRSWSGAGPWLSKRGEVVGCEARGDCYLWDDGDVTTIASGDGNITVSDVSDRGHVVGTIYAGEDRGSVPVERR